MKDSDRRTAAVRIACSLKEPDKDLISSFLNQWETLIQLKYPDEMLSAIFRDNNQPRVFQEKTDEKNKCEYLNYFYGTGLYKKDIDLISKHTSEHHKDLEKWLLEGSAKAVVSITTCIKQTDRNKYVYSFATKYCSFSNPLAYPIYDRNLKFVCEECNKQIQSVKLQSINHDFSPWNESDDETKYVNYKAFLFALLDYINYKTEMDISIRQLDKVLWLWMDKQLNPQRYYM